MKKKIFLSICLIAAMVTAFVAVPKIASAYVYDVYRYSVQQNGCNARYRVTYSVDIWNNVTEVGSVFDGYTNWKICFTCLFAGLIMQVNNV